MLESFLLDEGGQLSIGKYDPIPCAAILNDEHTMLVALRRRPGETLMQLLARLEAALGAALTDEHFIDEING